MNTFADKTQKNKSQSSANALTQKQDDSESTFQFLDNRPEAIALRKLQEMANNSLQVKQPIQKKENNTGLPESLKSGIENRSSYAMDEVKTQKNLMNRKSSMGLIQLVNKGNFRTITGNSGYVTLATDRRNMGHTYIILETRHGAWMYHFRADARNVFSSMVKMVTWFGSFEQIRRDPVSKQGRSPEQFVQGRGMNFHELKVKKSIVENVKNLCEQSVGSGTFSLVLSNIGIGNNCFSKVYNILKAAGFTFTWSSYFYSFVSPRLALSIGAGFYKTSNGHKKSLYSHR